MPHGQNAAAGRHPGMDAGETWCEAPARPPARSENERYDAQPSSDSYPVPVHHIALVSDLAKPGLSVQGCTLLQNRSGRTARNTLSTMNVATHTDEPGRSEYPREATRTPAEQAESAEMGWWGR